MVNTDLMDFDSYTNSRDETDTLPHTSTDASTSLRGGLQEDIATADDGNGSSDVPDLTVQGYTRDIISALDPSLARVPHDAQGAAAASRHPQSNRLASLISTGHNQATGQGIEPALQTIRQELLILSDRIAALEQAGVNTSSLNFAAVPVYNGVYPQQTATPGPSTVPVHAQASTRQSESLAPTPSSTKKHDAARARGRKVELSRAVRKTMLDMMGLASTSVDLPPFNPEDPCPVVDGKILWRWDWAKTVHASQHNAKFVEAIQSAVLARRDGAERLFNDVPAEDWPNLKNAIESAYVNLRREWDSRQTDDKLKRKDITRKRNRKRGLKEEKVKRRRIAWDIFKVTANIPEELNEMGIASEELAERALDIRYMSSEESDAGDDIAEEDPTHKIAEEVLAEIDPLLTPSTSLSLVPSKLGNPPGRNFFVRPPIWRAKYLANLYSRLDDIKPPERAYRRVVAEARSDGVPPENTPADILDPEWAASAPVTSRPKKRGRPSKRKADDIDA